MHDGIQFDVAEVLEYDNTYKWIDPASADSNTDQLFALKVKSCSGYFNQKPFIVKPSDINIKKIPLVGELVLIYKTFNQVSTSIKRRESWYYLTTVDLQSSIHANLLPGLAGGKSQEEIDTTKPGKTFNFKVTSPLQPYEGDILVEGRWGNSIRFGSTVDLTGNQRNYSNIVPWRGGADQGDPIIVLSNGRSSKPNKQFVAEDIQSDASSLYLTSTQKVPGLILGTQSEKNPLTCYGPNESQFAKSQLIGVADRIVLKSKTDITVIDSPKAIVLNTSGEVKLGSDSATESMVHGDVLLTVLQKILNQLNTPIQCGTMTGTFIDKTNISSAQTSLSELLSSRYFIDKNTY
jgi:hypothetical protein